MTHLSRIWTVLVITISVFNMPLFGQIGNSIELDSQSHLYCMQGIWSPINSRNNDIKEFVIRKNFKCISVGYKSDGEVLSFLVFYDGFYNFPEKIKFPSRTKDSVFTQRLQQNGDFYVWFRERDIGKSGWAKISGAQRGYECSSGFIELNDNATTILQRKLFLPYSAIEHIKNQGATDRRDYLKEMNIRPKKAAIKSKKAFFHNEPNVESKRKGFVVVGDQVFIDEIILGWAKVIFVGSKSTTKGWIKEGDFNLLE